MTEASKVWILIPVHNRRETTRHCLERLRELGTMTRHRVCVVDDACTDGTSEMLAELFPEVVVLHGDGTLYWGGGIAAGMRHALTHDAEVMVWLNDDCLPDPGSIEVLVDRVRATRGICGGVCHDPADSGRITYSGGTLDGSRARPAAGEFVTVYLINGNLVAVHRDVVRVVGLLPADRFPHYGGDSVYSLRARRRGIATEVAGAATAVNAPGDSVTRVAGCRSLRRVWAEMRRVPSSLYFPAYWRFLRELKGWRAWFCWPAYFIRVLRIAFSSSAR